VLAAKMSIIMSRRRGLSLSDLARGFATEGAGQKVNEIGHKRAFLPAVTASGRTASAAVQIGQIAVSTVVLDEISSKP